MMPQQQPQSQYPVHHQQAMTSQQQVMTSQQHTSSGAAGSAALDAHTQQRLNMMKGFKPLTQQQVRTYPCCYHLLFC